MPNLRYLYYPQAVNASDYPSVETIRESVRGKNRLAHDIAIDLN